ncbi:MAG: hypothetical protein LIO46_02810 [Clostridiales bacterium]|nr:hypothetical protein [Clostridiales bacterium]
MRKAFYPRLALTNMRKNSKIYLPYILSGAGMVMMFFTLCMITFNEGMNDMKGADQLRPILTLAVVVEGIFSAIFLFYTNSFLIRRRKKELDGKAAYQQASGL